MCKVGSFDVSQVSTCHTVYAKVKGLQCNFGSEKIEKVITMKQKEKENGDNEDSDQPCKSCYVSCHFTIRISCKLMSI